ncbi:1-phosphatidylinositol phosphodiesterase [Ceratocystis platani]|uniref:1-phosphatidylinositol phosphodiesterase n=1 Tax=Ceratocystis fimbriata f. sp. platani TaxID=88771 RepID=A0A0F8BK34_CERFI|nr:1-phosphatidylinositol phosphodiesterase [Ceratocystis platani]
MRFSLFAMLASLAFSHAGTFKGIEDPWSFDLNGNNADWMGNIPDNVHLSRLSIPGTHNSMTDKLDNSWIRSQNVPLKQQLTSGIRYFDISCRLKGHQRVYHGPADTGYSLGYFMYTMFDFLDAHPGETIILRIRKGGILEDTQAFLSDIDNYFISGSDFGDRAVNHIYSKGTDGITVVPTLGDVRGKIFILQDFTTSPAGRYGLDWDSPSVSSYGYKLSLGTLSLPLKWIEAKAHIKWAGLRTSNKLRITHTTASAGATPISIAAGTSSTLGMNGRLGKYLKKSEGNRIGIIAMDFPGQALVNHIVSLNDGYRDPQLTSPPSDGAAGATAGDFASDGQ